MTGSLRSTLSEFVESVDREVAATPIDARAAAAIVASRVVRRRAVRVAATSVVAAAAVVGIAISVYAVAGPEPAPPATIEPAPHPTPTTPSPTPTQEPPDPATPAVPQRTVTVHPLLPSALPLTEEVVRASAEPGWVLSGYGVASASDDTSFDLMYLISPTGEKYEIPWRLPAPPGETTIRIVDWLPGTTLVVVESTYERTKRQVFDVMTGAAVSTVFTNADGYYFPDVRLATPDSVIATRTTTTGEYVEELVRMSFDGTVLDIAPGPTLYKPWGLSPSRELVLDRERGQLLTTIGLDAVALPTLPADQVQGECWPLQWLSDEEIVMQCGTRFDENGQPAPNGQHWRVRLDGTLIEAFTTPGEVQLDNSVREFWLVDDVLYGQVFDADAPDTCSGRTPLVRLVDGQAHTTTAPSFGRLYGLTGGRLIVESGWCDSAELLAIDPATGATTTLLQTPADAQTWVGPAFTRDNWW